jgi:hypothetical protein
MHLGDDPFILQDYYVDQWANNLVFHMRVSAMIEARRRSQLERLKQHRFYASGRRQRIVNLKN